MIMIILMLVVMMMLKKCKPGFVAAKCQFYGRRQAILHRYCKHPPQLFHLSKESEHYILLSGALELQWWSASNIRQHFDIFTIYVNVYTFDWCWLMPTYADWCLLLLIDANWCWLMLIAADWCWLMLIGAERCRRVTQVGAHPHPLDVHFLPSSVGLWVVVGTIKMHSFNEMVVFTC